MQPIENESWSLTLKITFRFIFIFFGLWIIPFPFNTFPNDWVYNHFFKYYDNLWSFLEVWAGKTIFNLKEVLTVFNGSGDKTSDWLQLFLILIFSLIGTIIWSFFARNKKNHAFLNQILRVAIRYYLGYILISYGFAKIFLNQMGGLTSYRLYERFGDMSPMGVLWSFIAASAGFQIFTGICEFVAGFLLFFKRSTLFGALISITVVSNVVMLNFCYDVHVKIYSVLLLLMAFYLATPDLKRIIDFFFLNMPTVPNIYTALSNKKSYIKVRPWAKTIFIAGICLSFIYEGMSSLSFQNTSLNAIYGPYKVEKFIMKGQNMTSVQSDTLHWNELFIDRRGTFERTAITNDYNLKENYNTVFDFKKHEIMLKSRLDTSTIGRFSYQQPNTNYVILSGFWKKDSLKVELKKMNKKFLLTSRGFHWVNEMPFNK